MNLLLTRIMRLLFQYAKYNDYFLKFTKLVLEGTTKVILEL